MMMGSIWGINTQFASTRVQTECCRLPWAMSFRSHPMLSLMPHRGMSQLYRSPDTTHLVGNLKEQNRDLRVARDAMADELMTIRKSTRATRVAELQSEVFTSQIEMDRLLEINRVRLIVKGKVKLSKSGIGRSHFIKPAAADSALH